jgi:23S rRNA (uridine2552-2'-O)-methyltransferase
MTKRASGRGAKRVKPKNPKSRKASSNKWLERQLNDPYVRAAKTKGYRSRAAFKLIALDDKFHFLRPGSHVLDLGAAPGGWSQIARQRVGAKGYVVAVDIAPLEPIAGVTILLADLLDSATPGLLQAALDGPADVVLTDMAAPTTGHRETDHLRTSALLDVAQNVLKPGGTFVGKVFQGGATGELLKRLKASFKTVKHVKPPASRAESVELYLVALGFRAS